MPKLLQKSIGRTPTSATPIEINVKISKTVQEKQFEPLNYQVEMKSFVPANEIDAEFRRVSEYLEVEITRFFNKRMK